MATSTGTVVTEICVIHHLLRYLGCQPSIFRNRFGSTQCTNHHQRKCREIQTAQLPAADTVSVISTDALDGGGSNYIEGARRVRNVNALRYSRYWYMMHRYT